MKERTSKLRLLWLIAIVALMALVAVACGDDDDDDDNGNGNGGDVTYGNAGFKTIEIAAGAPIKIGISSILSGDLTVIGLPIADAAELAGEGKTLFGRSIEWVRRDDTCSADGGAAAATQLIQENVVAVIGPVCSGAVRASQPAYEEAGITQVSPSSTAISVTHPERGAVYKTFLRTTYSDAIQGPAQADFAYDTLNARTAYIVFDTDAYGSGLRDAFREAFVARGGRIVGSPEGFEKGATDFLSIVTNIQNANPDLVYFSGFSSEATPFIQQLRQENANVLFLAGDGVKNDEFIAGAGAAAENAYLSLPSPVYGSPAYETFGTAYEAKTGAKRDASPYTAEAYDAASIIIAAIEKVGVEEGGVLKIDLAKLNDEIRKTELAGAAGTIKFDARGENVGGETPVTLFKVTNGAYEQLQ
ncbi:MAG TPA: branched-chain amino acid ABC transporter substrate-binding protein [Tepidiformaceae bacterium]|nr:branched-chain amino acid ABC transporter substrate-binding protein [Tepidiformaceae bacterium]HMO94548.1 branched-chain amino acid ABC transporter substrate-binding protein [Tepidiformaceae bacterium]